MKKECKYTEVLSDDEEGEGAGGTKVFDPSKLELAGEDGVRQMGRDVVICRDLSQVQGMFEKQNIMKGMKSLEEIKKQEEERLEKEGGDPDKDVKMFKLPAAMFEDFAEIDYRNEEMFEFLAFNVVINYLE